MFNFTTLTIYNEIVKHDLKTEGRRIKKGANLIYGDDNDTPFVRIGNTRFDADLIESIEMKAPSKESLATVTFDFAKLLEKVTGNDGFDEITARIALYIGLSMNSLDSFYANDYVYKGKPFYIEFPVKKNDTGDTIAARVKKIATKFLLFQFEDKVLDVTVGESQAAVIGTGTEENPQTPAVAASVTFTGVNGYQLIKKAELLWYNPDAKTVDCCTMDGDFEVLVTGVPVAYTISDGEVATENKKVTETGFDNLADNEVAILPGLEAFGDYNWLIHNLRLPTAANTNFWSFTKQMGELPIPGQEYTQFIVRIATKRDGIAGGVVGQRAVSVTTHVFYALGDASTSNTPANLIKTALNTLATSASKTLNTTADTALANPFAGVPQD